MTHVSFLRMVSIATVCATACLSTLAVAQEQVITTQPSDQLKSEGSLASVSVLYTASDGDETLTGLGLRLHWDSTLLTFRNLTSIRDNGDLIAADNACRTDSENLDGVAATDCFVMVAWADPDGEFPGVGSTPTVLYRANFTSNVPPFTSTSINFSGGSQALGYSLSTASATVSQGEGVKIIFKGGFESESS